MAIRATKLSYTARLFIVRSLASFERPDDILAHLKQTFAVEVSPKALRYYSPLANPKLDADLTRLFYETRQTFWHEYFAEPLNNLSYRQQKRRELYEEAGNDHEFKLQIMESAADDERAAFARRKSTSEMMWTPGVTVGEFAKALEKRLRMGMANAESETEPSSDKS